MRMPSMGGGASSRSQLNVYHVIAIVSVDHAMQCILCLSSGACMFECNIGYMCIACAFVCSVVVVLSPSLHNQDCARGARCVSLSLASHCHVLGFIDLHMDHSPLWLLLGQALFVAF